MVVGDYLTKWMEAIPIPDAAAKTVADKFVERIVSIFGATRYLHIGAFGFRCGAFFIAHFEHQFFTSFLI
jgi:hypothetical protein